MKPLQVCHLGKYYPPAPGGIETHVRTLARAQAGLGARVRVFCVNHRGGPTAVEDDGPVEVTRFGRMGSGFKLDFCPDLVGRLRKVEADILHMHVPNPTMILALLAARPKPPLVVTYHSDVVNQKVRGALFRPLERLSYRKVKVILANSPTYPGGSSFLRRYTDRQPFTIFGDGKQIRDALWAGDLVEVYQRALERIDVASGQVFNIGGGPSNTLSLRELVARLSREFGRPLNPPHADWRPGDQRVFVADVAKAHRLLGWRPRVSIDEGVGRLIAWVKENRSLFAA